MKRQLKIYKGMVIFLLLLFLCMFVAMDKNYKDLLEVVDEQEKLIETQRDNYDSLNESWSNTYSKLQEKYGELLTENNELHLELEKVELPKYIYTEEEIYLLAKCVQAEAGSYKGHETSQRYIAEVILNRVEDTHFPNTIEEVIYEKHNGIPQFSVSTNGMLDESVPTQETINNVYKVLITKDKLPSYVLYFYSDYVTENWVNTLNTYDTVEGSVFAYSTQDKERLK